MTSHSGSCPAADVYAPGHLGALTRKIPPSLVDDVLEATGRRERRVRLLPARVVVYFVLAMALFSTDGYHGVWASLVKGLGGVTARMPSTPALSQARARLGAAPMAELFARLSGPVATTATPGAFWHSLRLMAWDGLHLEAADSPANAAAFGYLHARRGRSGFPLVRLAALVECGSRAIHEVAFGAYITAEKTLAQRLLGGLCPGMLLLADRNFDGYELWGQARDTGAHLLWRAKGVRILPRLVPLADGSYLSVLPDRNGRGYRAANGHRVRVIEFHLTVATSDGASRTEHYRLLTTLMDPRRHPADQLAALYHQRWEVEIAFFGLKVTLRTADRVLRSQHPEGVEQEIYAYLTVYQVLRRVSHHSARRVGVDPDRVSLTVALRAARHSVIAADHASPGTPEQTFHHLLTSELLPPRRADRVSPRAVKRPVSPFSYKQVHALRESRTSRRATYTVHLREPSADALTAPQQP